MTGEIVVIGAGPAGLTAAYELARAGRAGVTVLEASAELGGLSRTVNFNGNRIDIGGHRFFSKSDWVINWWRDMLPVAMPPGCIAGSDVRLRYQGAERLLGIAECFASESDAEVMLIRQRLSRIFWGGTFFDYPLKPGVDMVRKLGVARCAGLGASYLRSTMFPRRPEQSLEDFFINRFGRALYLQFFKEYTEKVWGVPCQEISAEWGAQRIKSLSIGAALRHALRRGAAPAPQTSLIESFLYPKYGPGQMWETVARRFESLGGRVIRGAAVHGVDRSEQRVMAVRALLDNGEERIFPARHVISTMPVRDLVAALRPGAPADIEEIASGLQYRDFITVGLLYRKLRPLPGSRTGATRLLPDNWIYIQEPGVKVGRLQVFNNWSPYLVADPDTVWVGLEYFAAFDDELWRLSDEQLRRLAVVEMRQLGLADEADVLDAVVVRMPKAYPGYFGSAYSRFGTVKDYLDGIPNLWLVGRNGMHRYNNQDHSMLSARLAVEGILQGKDCRADIWRVNIDDAYHEEHHDGGEGSP